MKNIPLSSAVIATALFVFFSLFLYLLNIQPFLFPHIPMYVIFVCSEKNYKKKSFLLLTAFLLYSQLATPFPLVFLTITSVQVYVVASSVFNVSAFDFSFSALMSGIFIQIVLNINRVVYLYVFSGATYLYSSLLGIFFASFILVFLFLYYKPHVDKIFVKDSWL